MEYTSRLLKFAGPDEGETVPVSAVYGCFVGSGLDRSGGLVGRHIPNVQICRGGIYPSREHSGCRKLPGRVKTLPYEPTGKGALRENAHRPHTSARRGRACPARRCTADGRLRETCGPGMPGPYRAVLTVKIFKIPLPCHNSDTNGWYAGENGTGKEKKP